MPKLPDILEPSSTIIPSPSIKQRFPIAPQSPLEPEETLQLITPQNKVFAINASNVIPYALPVASVPTSCPCYVSKNANESISSLGGGNLFVPHQGGNGAVTPIGYAVVLFYPLCSGVTDDQLRQVYPAFPSPAVVPYQCPQCQDNNNNKLSYYERPSAESAFSASSVRETYQNPLPVASGEQAKVPFGTRIRVTKKKIPVQ